MCPCCQHRGTPILGTGGWWTNPKGVGFDRLNQKVVASIDVESEQPFAFHEEVQSALENLAKEILKLWYYAEQFTSTPSE
jgi:hypothetical protein